MKPLAIGALAVAVLAGVTACGPSDEEKASQRDCVQAYMTKNVHEDPATKDELSALNKELVKACGVKDNYLHNDKL